MFEADTATSDIEKSIAIDGEIRYIRMRVDDGVMFDGIRLLDEEMNYIVDVTWN